MVSGYYSECIIKLYLLPMKKIFVFCVVLLGLQFGANAQAQELIIKYQLRTPEDKTKLAMEKLKDFKLSKDNNEKTSKVLMEFYKDQQKMLDGAIKNGVGNVDAYKAKKQKLVVDRDDKLKKIFTPDQFKNWVTVIEPALTKRPTQDAAKKS